MTLKQVPPAAHEPISADTRLFVWQRDKGRCRHCGAAKNLQFDHIIPRSRGGANTAENVELLCCDCNLKKGARLFVSARIAPGP
ncbi:MAG: HNH endonuclease [Planctomycetota bacterium]